MFRMFRCAFVAFALCVLLGAFSSESKAQAGPSPRQRIAACWGAGAQDVPTMRACTGLSITPPLVQSCLTGGSCFGEPPLAFVGHPLCGAQSTYFCPGPRPCGFLDTVPCPTPLGGALGCGAPPYGPCALPLKCGSLGGLPCPPPYLPATFNQVIPSYVTVLPATGNLPVTQTFMALPPVPDPQSVNACLAQATMNDFEQCFVEKALPPAYRITQACLSNSADAVEAYFCSTNNNGQMAEYKKVRDTYDCIAASSGKNEVAIAGCLGMPGLGAKERRYVECIIRNSSPSGQNWGGTAICALGLNVNPEVQIAIQCAAQTKGQPHAFAICTGGQLAAREIDKCWKNGIGTPGGCMGPNNEYRKYAGYLKNQADAFFGPSSAVAQAYGFWYSNLYMPGSSNTAVQLINGALNDLQHPGNIANNFAREAGNAMNNTVDAAGNVIHQSGQAAGNVITAVTGIKF